MIKQVAFIVVSFLSSFFVYQTSNEINHVPIKVQESAFMNIIIPKIKVDGNIYKKNSVLNDIDKNIIIMNESDLPDEEGTVIIGAHSGTGKYAYFKDLNHLSIDDEIVLYYQDKQYTYKVIDTHLDSKDGSITISKHSNKRRLVLYTCNPNDKRNFFVVVSELI